MVQIEDVIKTTIKKSWIDTARTRREAVDNKWGTDKMAMWGTPERRELGYIGERTFAEYFKLDLPGEMKPDGHVDFVIKGKPLVPGAVPGSMDEIGIDVKTAQYEKTFRGAFNNPNFMFQVLASQIELYGIPTPCRVLASVLINENRTTAYIVGWIKSSDVHLGPAWKTPEERAGYWKVEPNGKPAYYRTEWWRLHKMGELLE